MKTFFKSLKDGLASIGEGLASIGESFAPSSYEDYMKKADEYVERAKRQANSTRHYNFKESDKGLEKDSESLASDWKNVGDYLKKAMEKHKEDEHGKR